MAVLSPVAKQQFFTDAGLPAAGYLLYTYAANTTTPQATYSNRAGTVANANPIVLDTQGRATIYLPQDQTFDYVLKTTGGVTVWTQQGVESALSGADLAASTGSSLVGFKQSGTGAVARTMQDRGRERVSAKDFGAVGDAAIVAGVLTGTNDSAALNLAIAACGTDKVLEIPAGTYIITPGALDPIRCSVYAPEATFIGSVPSTDPGLDALFTLDYEETYPVTLGESVTGLNAWKTFHVHQIIGNPGGDAEKYNTAVYCQRLNQSQVFIDVIRGCSRGVHLHGPALNAHLGTNEIDIGHMYMCDVGVLLQSGDGVNMCEANRITGRYWYGFTTAAISLAGGGTAETCDNVFDVISIGVNYADAHCILLDSMGRRNHFTVRSWDSGISGAGKYIVAPAGSADNNFSVPDFSMSTVTWAGSRNIFHPQRTTHRPGIKVRRVTGQAITVATDTVILFNQTDWDRSTAYDSATGKFQPTIPGYYRVSASARLNGTSITLGGISLLKSVATPIDTILASQEATMSGMVVTGSTDVYLNGSTDYIQITAYIGAASDAIVDRAALSVELLLAT